MTTTIWKFELELTDHQVVQMPEHARILTVQMQGDKLCLWAWVTPTNKMEGRKFEIIGTGHTMPPISRIYIGTVQDRQFVLHIFEVDFQGITLAMASEG